MFRKKYSTKRRSNPIFFLFRLVLSLSMFGLLLMGLYLAYKNFAGIDPLNIDPKSMISLIPEELSKYLPSNFGKTSIPKSQDILSKIGLSTPSNQNNNDNKQPNKQSGQALFSFILVADSHNDNSNLKKALTMAKAWDAQFLIGLGDYTQVGTLEELKNTKAELDLSGIRYFLTPGDHDLWDSRDKSRDPLANFNQVFGPTYQSFNYKNFKFLILNNSDNYLGLDQTQMDWLKNQLNQAKEQGLNILVFLHEPLFHPSSDHFMGRVEPKLKDQARELIKLFSEYNVKKVFAGDTHYFSEYSEPETNLSMVTVGAIAAERNLQLPRFAKVSIYGDETIKVEDIEIK